MSKKAGQPTKYKEEYCELVIEFFNRPLWEKKKVQILDRGRMVLKEIDVPCQLPTIERFALNIGVHFDTVYEWAKVHPKFSESLRKAQQAQKEILIQHGLSGQYKEGFAKFVAVNFTNMQEKVHQEVDSNISLELNYKL
jgi:hypothetical protein